MKLHLVLALFAAQSLHAGWVIVEKTSNGGKDKQVTIKIKDGLIREDMGDQMTLLLNADDGVVQMFMHARKTVMRVDVAALKNMGAMAGKLLGGDEAAGPPAKPKATGEKARVGGWDTEIYTWQGKFGTGKFYVTKDFSKFAELNKAMDKVIKASSLAATNGGFPNLADFPGMVVKSEKNMMGRAVTSELISVKEEPLGDSDFKAPEGYTEMKMPSLPGGVPPRKQ